MAMLCPPLGSSVHEALYTGDIGEIELRRGSSHLLLSSAFFILVHVQISPPQHQRPNWCQLRVRVCLF